MPEGKDKEASSRDLAVAAARAAADKQGERVAVLDVRELIVITDYFVITSGGSQRQVRTIVEEIEKALRDLGRKPVRREGLEDGRWKPWVAGAAGLYVAFRLAEIRQLRKMNKALVASR